MAVGTTSPVKILLDLGIDLDNLSSEEDYLSALKEGAAILQVGGKTDERFKILADEVRRVRSDRKEADPTFKTRKVSVNKLMNRKVSSSQKVAPQKLLPAASEEGGAKDQTIITSNLAERLSSIQESLQNLGKAFRQQLLLDKRVAAVDARNAKEADKLEKEKQLETKKRKKIGGLGFKKLIRPAIGFFDTLLNFFKNIFMGSILVGLLDWIDDNKGKVDKFAQFFTDKLPLILTGIGALVGISFLGPILTVVGALKWAITSVIGGIAWLGRRLFPQTFTPKPTRIIPPRTKIRTGSSGLRANRFTKPISPGRVGGTKPGRAPLIPKPGQGITRAAQTGSKFGFLKKIPFGKLGGMLRVIGLGFLVAELKKDWDAGDYYAVMAKLTAYGAGWIVTTLGWTASWALAGAVAGGTVGLGTPGALAIGVLGSAGAIGAGAKTDQVVRDMLLGKSTPSTASPPASASVSNNNITPPPITSSTGTGNIQFLDLRGGGGQPQPAAVGGDGSGVEETVPSFSSHDPNNLTTVTVRSIYGLVN